MIYSPSFVFSYFFCFLHQELQMQLLKQHLSLKRINLTWVTLTFWVISTVKERLFCFDSLGQFGVSNIIV